MLNIDKVKQLTKEKGWSLSFLCSKMGVYSSYINDVRRGKAVISNERLTILAELLDTSIDYLTDKTDIKKAITNSDGKKYVVDEQEVEMLNLYEKLSPEFQRLAREQLRILRIAQDSKDKK
jgi:transcriptional regulator with XRE-family HTH domain